MRTPKQAANESGLPERLIMGVLDGIDPENVPDIVEHGADAGWGNFCYYADTVKFAENYRADISDSIKRLSEDMGEDAVSFMASFGCLRQWDNAADRKELRDAIGFFLYSSAPCSESNDLAVQVFNAAALFALEECARALVEE